MMESVRSAWGRIALYVRGRWIAFACVAIALAINAVAVSATIAPFAWSPTALVHMGSTEPLAPIALKADPGFRFVSPAAHYDGVYYYAIARDPLALHELHPLIDRPGYRYGHPGFGWLAWAVSLGQTGRVPDALLAINLAAVAVAAFVASVLAQAYGWSQWGGLVVAFNPGIVYSVTADTSEPLALALIALAILAWTRRRWFAAGVALVAGCLTKEPLLAVPVGLAAWELIELVRGARPRDLLARATALLVGPVFFALWWTYLHADFGHLPSSEARDLTSSPFKGWLDSFRIAGQFANGDFNTAQIGVAAIALMATLGGVLLLALLLGLRARTPFDTIYVCLGLVAFSLSWWGLLFPKRYSSE